MRTHTQEFKVQIKELGRQIDNKITFGETIISNENLYSITPIINGNILKSAMKELDFETNVNIPLNTIIKYEFGLLVNEKYEYLDYGNYIVYSSEYNEDTKIYNYVCYDAMLFSMKDYTNLQSSSILNKSFPMTIRDYITCLCTDIGLIFADSNNIFANYNKEISSDIYDNLGYTYRDIFDELAQVTASTICINNNNELEIRYLTDTNDTIDEEYLKDINVKFGEKYGPINSIVLSRSAESDNVYLQDEESVSNNGLHELKIIDNQIMNFNDRSDYLSDILAQLNGLNYYINDFTSTGIMYYELCDKYNVKIGENTYNCILFNDEQKITQGLVEDIYTELPNETETDYIKSDKTDRKINQTYLIVDKQNQIIESVVNQTTEQNNKISKITQSVDELNSKISDVADITTSNESTYAKLEFTKINQSEPILIKIHPISKNISYLYPCSSLYPSSELYSTTRILRFSTNQTIINEETGEEEQTDVNIDYELPDDLLYYNEKIYDEFHLNYDNQICQVIKRCSYDENGNVYALDEEIIKEYEYPKIQLIDGDYTIDLLGYDSAYLYITLMAQNIYITQFATRAEVSSEINQTTNEINLSIDKKLTNYSTTTQMNSAISQTANSITQEVNLKISNQEKDINAKLELKVNEDDLISQINASADEINLKSNRLTISSDYFNLTKTGRIKMTSPYNDPTIAIGTNSNNDYNTTIAEGYIELGNSTNKNGYIYLDNIKSYSNNDLVPTIWLGEKNSNVNYTTINSRMIDTPILYQHSLAEMKKNFELFDNGLQVVNNTDIYKYNLKSEKDTDKKHIGFIIGNDYNYSNDITAEKEGKEIGVDLYSMVAVAYKAIQEQQVIIEKLKQEINSLKESDK